MRMVAGWRFPLPEVCYCYSCYFCYCCCLYVRLSSRNSRNSSSNLRCATFLNQRGQCHGVTSTSAGFKVNRQPLPVLFQPQAVNLGKLANCVSSSPLCAMAHAGERDFCLPCALALAGNTRSANYPAVPRLPALSAKQSSPKKRRASDKCHAAIRLARSKLSNLDGAADAMLELLEQCRQPCRVIG